MAVLSPLLGSVYKQATAITTSQLLGYSQLSLNGHLYKIDTWCWLLPFSVIYCTMDTLNHSTDTQKVLFFREKYLKTEMEVLNMTVNYDFEKQNL